MAHTNSTTNYNLPQWVGSDKPTFLGDLNTAFNDIDAQMKTNADGIVAADDKAQNATTLANDAQDDVDALTLRVTTAEGDIANNTTLIGNNTTSINNLTSSIDTINTQLGNKQNTITGAASTVTASNLTASRVLVSDSAGKITNSSISDTELGRLSGVTSNIQDQINNIHSNLTLIASGTMPTVRTSWTVQNISNFVELIFILHNPNGGIIQSNAIARNDFINSSMLVLRDFSSNPLTMNLFDVQYVDNNHLSVLSDSGASNYNIKIYGR